jgi:hypothetical protein
MREAIARTVSEIVLERYLLLALLRIIYLKCLGI